MTDTMDGITALWTIIIALGVPIIGSIIYAAILDRIALIAILTTIGIMVCIGVWIIFAAWMATVIVRCA